MPPLSGFRTYRDFFFAIFRFGVFLNAFFLTVLRAVVFFATFFLVVFFSTAFFAVAFGLALPCLIPWIPHEASFVVMKIWSSSPRTVAL